MPLLTGRHVLPPAVEKECRGVLFITVGESMLLVSRTPFCTREATSVDSVRSLSAHLSELQLVLR